MNYLCLRIFKICLLILLINTIGCKDTIEKDENITTLINKYRSENGLSKIPISPSLTIVAETHVKDLYYNHPDTGKCNTHSWSDKGSWTPFCYSADHAEASKMWIKPSELTTYTGYGFEITAFSSDDNISANEALSSWLDSKEHRSILLNQDNWSDVNWNAIGSAIFKGYAAVWFGKEVDSANN